MKDCSFTKIQILILHTS